MAGSSRDSRDADNWESMSTPSPVLKRRRLCDEQGMLPDWIDRPGIVKWERRVTTSGEAATNDVASVKATRIAATAAPKSKPRDANHEDSSDSYDSCLIRSDGVAPLSPSPLPPTPSDDDALNLNMMKTPCKRTSLTSLDSPPGPPVKNQKQHFLFKTPSKKPSASMVDTPDPLPKYKDDPFPGYVPDPPETYEPSAQAVNDAPEGWLLEWDFLTPEQRGWIIRNPWAAQTLNFPIASWSPFNQFSG